MEKRPTTEKTISIDPLIPVGELDTASAPDCFGKAWNISAKACHQCADRDTCGIIYQKKVVNPKIDALEKKTGSYFLDRMCFEKVTEETLRSVVSEGDTTQQLIKAVSDIATCSDIPSVVNFLKTYLKEVDFIGIKEGRIWLKS